MSKLVKPLSNLAWLWLLYFLGAASYTLRAQVYPVDALAWTVVQPDPDRLRGGNLIAVVEDHDGRIFTANRRGIFRVVQQRMEPVAGQGIRGLEGEVQQLFTDAAKSPWVLTSKGLYHMDADSLSFRRVKVTIQGKTWEPVHRRFAALGQNIMLLYEGGLYLYHAGKDSCFRLATSSQLPQPPMRVYAVDGAHAVVTGRQGIQLWYHTGKMLRQYALHDSTEVRSALLLNNLLLYFWRHDACLQWIDLKSGNVAEPIRIDVPVSRSLSQLELAGRSYAVLGGPDSLYFFTPGSPQFFTWGKSRRQMANVPSDKLDDPMQDSHGRLWLIDGKQLAYSRVPKGTVRTFFTHNSRLDTAAPKMFEEPGVIQASRYHGRVIYAAGHQLFVFDTVQKRVLQHIQLPSKGTIGVDQLVELDAFRWLVVARYGLFLWEIKQNRLSALTASGRLLSRSSLAVSGDTVFCLSNHELFSSSSSQLVFTHHPLPLPNTWQRVFEGPVGSLLLASQDGLWIYRSATGQVSRLLADTMSLPGNSWYNARMATNGHNGDILVWLEDRLWVLDATEGKLRHHWVLKGASAPFGEVQMVPVDANHVLLVQPNMPVTVVNYLSGKARHLGVAEGWLGTRLGTHAQWTRGPASDWWASFDGGLQQFTDQWLLDYREPIPSPVIDDVWVGFKSINLPPSRFGRQVFEMSWQQGTISFFLGGAMVDSIVYRLWPYDTVWRKGTTPTFTNLPGGRYTLMVRTNGPDEPYSSVVQFPFKVLPPFWKTNVFRIGGSLVLTMLIIGGIAWRNKKWKQQQRQQLQLVQSELKAIRSQMNPHFIFNCLTAIDGLIATGQSRQASLYLGKFSRLVRQVLQLSEKALVPLGSELDLLVLYLQLEQLRMNDGFTYDIRVDEPLRNTVEVPPMLLQPFVENAIVHGLKNSNRSNKFLLIQATTSESAITLVVEDNGIGRGQSAAMQTKPKSQESMGMRLTADRIRMMEQLTGHKTVYHVSDLTDIHGRAAGTRVSIIWQKAVV